MPPETGPLDAQPSLAEVPADAASGALTPDPEGYDETAREVLRKVDGGDPPPREFALGEQFPLLGESRRVVASTQRRDHALAHLQAGAHTADFQAAVERHRPEFDYDEWLDSGGIALWLPH